MAARGEREIDAGMRLAEPDLDRRGDATPEMFPPPASLQMMVAISSAAIVSRMPTAWAVPRPH